MNSQTSSAADRNSGDEKEVVAINTLYKQMIDRWNSGSGDAFAGPFTDDSDFIGFDGTHMKGRQEIALFHQCSLTALSKAAVL